MEETVLRLAVLVTLLWTLWPVNTVRALDETPESVPLRVLTETSSTLTLDVSLPDPTSPVTALLAIPPQAIPEVAVTAVEQRLFSMAPGQEAPRWLQEGTPQVVIQPLGYLRSVRLARLVVHPTFEDATGNVVWTPRLQIRLAFPATAAREIRQEPPVIERLLARAVLNPAQARLWRRPRALSVLPPTPSSPLPENSEDVPTRSSQQDAQRGGSLAQIPDNPAAHDGNALRLRVEDSGIYRITRDDLAAAGWNVETLDPQNVQLWLNGSPVPVWFTGQRDGRMDPGDEIRFYVPEHRSRYTTEQVYWLTVEQAPGTRWRSEVATPSQPADVASVWFVSSQERDKIYASNYRDSHNEPWFWFDLRFLDFPPYPAFDFPFSITAPASLAQTTVTLSLYGYMGEQHDLAIAINGVPVGELHRAVQGRWDVTFSVPDYVLHEGENTLTIRGTDRGATPDGIYVDRITVLYRRALVSMEGTFAFTGKVGDHTYQVTDLPRGYALVLDVTNPLQPVLLTGGETQTVDGRKQVTFRRQAQQKPSFHVQTRERWRSPVIERNEPSNWHNPSEGADVVVIAPRAWHDTLRPWVQFRRDQGHRVRVVALQDIYDEFSFGQVDPEAIRSFLRLAYATWPEPAPLYVLLVGDGSYDFKDNLGFHPDNILPPYLADVDPWLGETAADLRYVEVSGDDGIPDMFLGRWPVGNRTELRTVINKVLAYEQQGPAAEWQRHITFVVDNYHDPYGNPDGAGDFVAQAERTASGQLSLPFVVDRLYYAPWQLDRHGTHTYSDAAEMRAQVRLIWNRGSGIINWIGHASYEQWGVENFLHARDLDAIQNGKRLPFLFSITCFTGYFQHPEYPALDEVLLVKPDGGTIASWSPTGLAVAYGHRYLQEGFYEALVDGERVIGALTLAGQLRVLSEADTYAFLPQTFVVLGDPLLRLRLGPIANWQFLPTVHTTR